MLDVTNRVLLFRLKSGQCGLVSGSLSSLSFHASCQSLTMMTALPPKSAPHLRHWPLSRRGLFRPNHAPQEVMTACGRGFYLVRNTTPGYFDFLLCTEWASTKNSYKFSHHSMHHSVIAQPVSAPGGSSSASVCEVNEFLELWKILLAGFL